MPTVSERIATWGMSIAQSDLLDVDQQIAYLADHLYYQYNPTTGPFPDFRTRLDKWIDQVPIEADQQNLVRLVPNIFFVGLSEFHALYRAAYNGTIANWLIEQLNADITDPSLVTILNAAFAKTWFCPITDSMQIAAFCHVNKVEGCDYRPDWHSLSRFANPQNIRDYMDQNGFERIVLLEDFVGSGSQMSSVVQFAATQVPGTPPVLVVPLLCFPTGAHIGNQLSQQYGHVQFSPVLTVSASVRIAPTVQPGEPPLHAAIRDVLQRTYAQVNEGLSADDQTIPYGPFGFVAPGGLVVMYSNCPDNTLPAVQHNSKTWSALFPRSSRL